MKYLIALFCCTLFACSSENVPFSDSNELIGKWELVEMLMDPGDGSGEFQATTWEVILSIEDNQDVIANGILCGFGESADLLYGKLSIADSTIITSCQNGELTYSFNIDESHLILSSHHCIEPCMAKFIKVK